MRVSLADVEILRQAQAQLASYMESLESCCASEVSRMQSIEEQLSTYHKSFSEAVAAAQNNAEQARQAYHIAQQSYNQASYNLERARSNVADAAAAASSSSSSS